MGLLGRYRTVDVAGAERAIADGAVLVDVRSAREFAAGHADGAINLPLGEVDERVGELPGDREVIVMCHTGIRSAVAARKLGRLGLRVGNLRGGLIAWDRAHE